MTLTEPQETCGNFIKLLRWLNTARKKRMKIIEPAIIAKNLNIPVKEITYQLDVMVEEGTFKKKWVIFCPECGVSIVELPYNPNGRFNALLCDCCGIEVVVRNAKIQVKYEII